MQLQIQLAHPLAKRRGGGQRLRRGGGRRGGEGGGERGGSLEGEEELIGIGSGDGEGQRGNGGEKLKALDHLFSRAATAVAVTVQEETVFYAT